MFASGPFVWAQGKRPHAAQPDATRPRTIAPARIGTKIGGVPHRTSAVEMAATKATMIIESVISASSAVKGLGGTPRVAKPDFGFDPPSGGDLRPRRRADAA